MRHALKNSARRVPAGIETARCASGFGLLEVLIALVIASVGLLAMAALNVVSMRVNHNSQIRTYAIVLTDDLADRMRRNPTALSTYAADATLAADAAVPAASGCVACTPDQLAALDAAQWLRKLRAALPNAASTLACDTGKPSACRLTLAWDERLTEREIAANTPATTSVTTVTVLSP